MAFGNPFVNQLRPATALEQLLEEICYQRAREIRQCLKEDSGFVMLNAGTFWTDLFVRHFLFPPGGDTGDSDDLLFFVRKRPKKGTQRYIPQFETVIEVFRKDSKKLPIGDPDVDWEETVYLNLIIQQFEYTLTVAVCTRTSPNNLQILRRHSQKVYSSPSRRQMQHKGEAEEITYPNIFFMIDNFDEVFSDLVVRDGEMVCVELVAGDRHGTIQGVIFQGSIHYEALKRVYDARTSLTSKVAQRMSMGWYQGTQRMEFVRMKGPLGKGHAEMAVSKQKGSGVETPTSEPGFCITDQEWDDDPEDYPYMKRRMSDPSSNLANFVRGVRPKPASEAAKSRSENEGLDSYANGYNEIEAGDLRDDAQKQRLAPVNDTTKVSHQLPNSESNQCVKDFLPKNNAELDDTTYKQLWTTRGFNQAYHFWKESRRAQSTALNAYLTYVTLPWHHIITDLLDGRQEPVLTF